ncbi:E3 ubiquitin- ligase ORTHRUS 2-like [Chlorella sorokiniana]|uniref:E3 ubiquitin-ligase ORTHRUS 2-like n=1 Tax=Chlorella sorokiniana TaxID=3076 RepID=A0A2P6TUR2_CHLSO|nr:E3 ubiquitin- ligase ORTHRUS 2-like [Chlorella sorokiniana]|eukprot:PRW57809.1 E3 ubiquitin- ligase ORTHRUS 2-like [Chlorella sorokiniana]
MAEQPHMPREDREFLQDSPDKLAALAAGHASKFVSGGLEKREENVLFTEPGLHPGSPRWQPQQQPWQTGAQLQQAEARQWGAEVGPVAGTGASGREAAVGPPAPGPSKPEEDGGDDFVYGQAAGSFDFAAEDMDAS